MHHALFGMTAAFLRSTGIPDLALVMHHHD